MDHDREPARSSLYDTDFYTWTREQARLLRAGAFTAVDLEHVVEEIETLGRSEAAAVRSSLRLVLMHMLKMRDQPDRASRAWSNTVRRERVNLERLLKDNPGLKPRLPELFLQAYEDAREEAIIETGLPAATFPATSDVSLDQVRDKEFLPALADPDPSAAAQISGDRGRPGRGRA